MLFPDQCSKNKAPDVGAYAGGTAHPVPDGEEVRQVTAGFAPIRHATYVPTMAGELL